MNHTAWRMFNDGTVGYVESISTSGKGDPYSYTSSHEKALQMTEQQCKTFCRYMYDCGTVGFWS